MSKRFSFRIFLVSGKICLFDVCCGCVCGAIQGEGWRGNLNASEGISVESLQEFKGLVGRLQVQWKPDQVTVAFSFKLLPQNSRTLALTQWIFQTLPNPNAKNKNKIRPSIARRDFTQRFTDAKILSPPRLVLESPFKPPKLNILQTRPN
jgi:hypothetical protein